jgi:hypothetical protein
MTASDSLSARVWKTAEDFEEGSLRYGSSDVTIELKSGEVISSKNSSNVIFEVMDQVSLDRESRSVVEPIQSKLEILLKPILVILHPYTEVGGQVVEDVFPPSTSGFYGRLLNAKSNE